MLAGNSISWINKFVAVGLATSYVGLSAKIYTDIVDVFSSSSDDATSRAKNYLLLNSILPLIVSLVTTPMLLKDVVSSKDTKEDKAVQSGFTVMFFVTIITGIYSVIGSLGWNKVVVSPWLYAVGLAVLLILIPLMIPLGLRVGSMDGDHVSANSNDEVVMEMKDLAEVVAQDSISISDSDDSIGSCTTS
ncbi:hypothetical protein MKW94_014754, partial [Papaver nudicaule]|nr:hypothetical protein [Papaver nudicaule]